MAEVIDTIDASEKYDYFNILGEVGLEKVEHMIVKDEFSEESGDSEELDLEIKELFELGEKPKHQVSEEVEVLELVEVFTVRLIIDDKATINARDAVYSTAAVAVKKPRGDIGIIKLQIVELRDKMNNSNHNLLGFFDCLALLLLSVTVNAKYVSEQVKRNCHTEYVTEIMFENQCSTSYEEECSTVKDEHYTPKVEDMYNTVDVQECSVSHEHVCTQHDDKQCSTKHEEQCTTVYEEECKLIFNEGEAISMHIGPIWRNCWLGVKYSRRGGDF